MEKLRSRKAEVGEQLDRSRAATRFEAARSPSPMRLRPDRSASRSWKGGPMPDRARAAQKPQSPSLAAPAPETDEAESYTNRLLKAKQRVWEEREKEKEPERKTPSHEQAAGFVPLADSLDRIALSNQQPTSTKGPAPMAAFADESMEARADDFARPTSGSRPRSAR